MAKRPKESGYWWIQFDDGCNYVTGPVLAKVTKCKDYGDFSVVTLDGTEWTFEPKKITDDIVRVSQASSLSGLIRTFSQAELRVHWLKEVKPPKAPGKGDDLPRHLLVGV